MESNEDKEEGRTHPLTTFRHSHLWFSVYSQNSFDCKVEGFRSRSGTQWRYIRVGSSVCPF